MFEINNAGYTPQRSTHPNNRIAMNARISGWRKLILTDLPTTLTNNGSRIKTKTKASNNETKITTRVSIRYLAKMLVLKAPQIFCIDVFL
jgi:hypothetical protein